MNWDPLPETRCKYIHVRSDAASMRHTVSGNESHFMPLTVNGTAVNKGYSLLIYKGVLLQKPELCWLFSNIYHLSENWQLIVTL